VIQKEYIGFGGILHLKEILAELNAQSIFLVTGNKSYVASGAQACLEGLLKDYTVHRFCDYSANPKCEDVKRGIELFRKRRFDTVIAVGGGSAIDMAKLINFLSVNPSAFEAYDFGSGISGSAVRPLIAIPTTAGSGSEATSFAVLYAGKKKHSIDDPSVLPAFSIVDSDLTMSLPEYVTAVSGMDALSQGIESYWSVNSNDDSKDFAAEAIRLAVSNLEDAVNDPTEFARLNMAKAAHLSGKAINITRTTAPHAISYPLTSFFGLAHGQAVGLTLSALLTYNAEVTDENVLDERGAEYVRRIVAELCAVLGAGDSIEAAEKINSMMRNIGLKTRLGQIVSGNPEDIKQLVSEGCDPNRMKNNPRKVSKAAVRKILESL